MLHVSVGKVSVWPKFLLCNLNKIGENVDSQNIATVLENSLQGLTLSSSRAVTCYFWVGSGYEILALTAKKRMFGSQLAQKLLSSLI